MMTNADNDKIPARWTFISGGITVDRFWVGGSGIQESLCNLVQLSHSEKLAVLA
jgi:hypothetical protein